MADNTQTALVISLIALVLLGIYSADLKSTNKVLQNEKSNLKSEINSLEDQKSDLNDEINSKTKEIKQLSQRIQKINSTKQNYAAYVDTLNRSLVHDSFGIFSAGSGPEKFYISFLNLKDRSQNAIYYTCSIKGKTYNQVPRYNGSPLYIIGSKGFEEDSSFNKKVSGNISSIDSGQEIEKVHNININDSADRVAFQNIGCNYNYNY